VTTIEATKKRNRAAIELLDKWVAEDESTSPEQAERDAVWDWEFWHKTMQLLDGAGI
jgi:hypothetical protein